MYKFLALILVKISSTDEDYFSDIYIYSDTYIQIPVHARYPFPDLGKK